nr:reverse transcriptase domain-containing protein [Tanacetum cinerariifolium]
MPKFASTLKALIRNKKKLSEMARTTMNEHCSAVIWNKLPRKLGDPDNFLIPCEFSRMDECLTLADLGASINLMPLSVWEGLLLPELTPTCMNLELANGSVSKPIGIAKDVSFKRMILILRKSIHSTTTRRGIFSYWKLLPSFKEELKAYEAQTVKSSVDEPPEVELKDLPYHLEYAFLEGDNKLPVIIAKELGSEEKSALIKVLKSHKRAIA